MSSLPGSLPQRLSPGGVACDTGVAVASDDEDDMALAELVALLALTRLEPTTSRRPIAAILYDAAICMDISQVVPLNLLFTECSKHKTITVAA